MVPSLSTAAAENAFGKDHRIDGDEIGSFVLSHPFESVSLHEAFFMLLLSMSLLSTRDVELFAPIFEDLSS